MSSTEYSRRHTLRLSDEERAMLALLVMREIEHLTQRPDAELLRHGVRVLRSLLERLTD